MTPRPSRLTISQIETLAQYAGDDQSSSWGTASLSPLSRSSSNPSSYNLLTSYILNRAFAWVVPSLPSNISTLIIAHEEAASPFNPHVDGNSSDEESDSFHYVPPTRRRRLSLCRCFGWAITLLSIILISAFAGAWISMVYVNIDQNCAAHTSQWSLLRNINNNASPEVDAAWEALGVDYRSGVISYKDGLSSGLDDSFVQRAPQHGGGFIINVEGMHHLHCLNLLRKFLWYKYEYYKDLGGHAFKNDGEVFRMHVTHCLDTVRQVLMCNVDTGGLGQV
ncbi:uncharacterized protein FRV6_11703 [Fusarium oxysporum]|uniref:Tat pathway signal sequence n=1 Tax=Fusarium oxysporum TaxID=5507 RepID=A0A2H3TW83_FUSOX|nr:uncharacterized protein FRV6_11703 [Fusarium oxysporum]